MPFSVFDTTYIDHPDYNSSDHDAECRRLFARQRAIQGLIDGTVDPDYLLDLLEDQGVSPTEYVETVEDNLLWLVSGHG